MTVLLLSIPTCIFVSTKSHFDETIIHAGLVSLFDVRRSFVCPTFMETLRWDNFCNFGATLLRFGTLLSNIILPWLKTFLSPTE